MHPLLAAADSAAPTSADIGSWVLVLFALLTGVSTLLQVVAFFRPKPANHEVYARKDELEKVESRFDGETQHLHKRVSDLRAEVTQQFAAQREAAETRSERIIDEIKALRGEMRGDIQGLHNRITDTQRSVARIEGARERHGQ